MPASLGQRIAKLLKRPLALVLLVMATPANTRTMFNYFSCYEKFTP